jgi:serine/threonine-protein kinase
VTITYSTGLGKASVPNNLAGLPLAEAEKQLKARGFKSIRLQKRFSSSVDAGKVISTDPPGGTLAARGQTITIVVSRGANLVSVPSVIGSDRASAIATITQQGLKAKVTRAPSADAPADQVTAQSPTAGSQAKPGSIVVITVSTGPQPITLPNVVGQTKADAIATLKNHGVSGDNIVVQDENTTDESQRGRILDETPPGGSQVLPTDQVTIYVGRFTPPTTSTTTTTTPSTTTTTPSKPRGAANGG